MKELVAKEVARRVNNEDVLGIGTGSTVDAAIKAIGDRIKNEGLCVYAVPTSYQTVVTCQNQGIHVLSPLYQGRLNWGFDGADEVDPSLQLIKGRGGAMLQEKILACKCDQFIVIVDSNKLVKHLGERFPVPIEVVPSAMGHVTERLMKLGATSISHRRSEVTYGLAVTEAGNVIFDVAFKEIRPSFEKEIKDIVGVVEHGLFIDYADEVLVATGSGILSLTLDGAGKLLERRL